MIDKVTEGKNSPVVLVSPCCHRHLRVRHLTLKLSVVDVSLTTFLCQLMTVLHQQNALTTIPEASTATLTHASKNSSKRTWLACGVVIQRSLGLNVMAPMADKPSFSAVDESELATELHRVLIAWRQSSGLRMGLRLDFRP